MISTALAFLLTLAILIVIHEYGHYRVAVACGVKVLRFSVGFGRVIWRHQRSPAHTEFVLSALPLGGYVRMLDEREAPVAPHERARAFNNKALWQRAAIVAAGPLANLLLAVLLYAAAHWIGVDEPKALIASPGAGSVAERAGLRAGDLVTAVAADNDGSADEAEWRDVHSLTDLRWELVQAALHHERVRLMVSDRQHHGSRSVTLELDRVDARDVDAALLRRIGLGAPYAEPVLGDLVAGGPAARAGLKSGDRVLQVDGEAVGDGQALRNRIRESGRDGAPPAQVWRIERDGGPLDLTVTPRRVSEGQNGVGRVDAVIGRQPEMVTVRYGGIDGLVQGAHRTWDITVLTLKMLGRMLIGQASLKNLSGPLTIADYAGQSVHEGLAYYLGFLAGVSISLGVLNLLPLPMLDGGHLMYYIFEAATGRPVSDLWLKWLQRGGALIMLLLMSLALSNDVARLLALH